MAIVADVDLSSLAYLQWFDTKYVRGHYQICPNIFSNQFYWNEKTVFENELHNKVSTIVKDFLADEMAKQYLNQSWSK